MNADQAGQNNFAPRNRISLYSVTPKTVLRGAYGVFTTHATGWAAKVVGIHPPSFILADSNISGSGTLRSTAGSSALGRRAAASSGGTSTAVNLATVARKAQDPSQRSP